MCGRLSSNSRPATSGPSAPPTHPSAPSTELSAPPTDPQAPPATEPSRSPEVPGLPEDPPVPAPEPRVPQLQLLSPPCESSPAPCGRRVNSARPPPPRRHLAATGRTSRGSRGSRSARTAEARAELRHRSPRRSPRAGHLHTDRRCLSAALGGRLNIELLPSRCSPVPPPPPPPPPQSSAPAFSPSEQTSTDPGDALSAVGEPYPAAEERTAEPNDDPPLTLAEIRRAAQASSISQAITSATCQQQPVVQTVQTVRVQTPAPEAMSLVAQKKLQWSQERGEYTQPCRYEHCTLYMCMSETCM